MFLSLLILGLSLRFLDDVCTLFSVIRPLSGVQLNSCRLNKQNNTTSYSKLIHCIIIIGSSVLIPGSHCCPNLSQLINYSRRLPDINYHRFRLFYFSVYSLVFVSIQKIYPSNFVKIFRYASYFQLSSRCLEMKHSLSCLTNYIST